MASDFAMKRRWTGAQVAASPGPGRRRGRRRADGGGAGVVVV